VGDDPATRRKGPPSPVSPMQPAAVITIGRLCRGVDAVLRQAVSAPPAAALPAAALAARRAWPLGQAAAEAPSSCKGGIVRATAV
jgi:hypothetical protein